MLKNVRAGIMPPAGKPRPSDKEVRLLADWIKRDVFGIDPKDPDPGRVTIRRLNRVEYRNTIRDLTGFDFKAEEEFPPDDTGYGFDTIGDVLSVSPLLLEKYMQAAESIVAAAVPTVSRLVPERTYRGVEFRAPDGTGNGDRLTFYKQAKVSRSFSADAGRRLSARARAGRGRRVRVRSRPLHGHRQARRSRAAARDIRLAGWQDVSLFLQEHLPAGDHRLTFELEPLTPARETSERSLDFRIVSVKVQGPLDPKHWTRPRNYDRFFSKDEPPADGPGATASTPARSCADSRPRRFGVRWTTGRSTGWWRSPKGSIGSPASGSSREWRGPWWPCSPRLASCFAWKRPNRMRAVRARRILSSTNMPWRHGSRIFSGRRCPTTSCSRLAERGELRKDLAQQVKRMREDSRAESLTRNFVGQWLQVRDVEGFTINTRAVLRQDGAAGRGSTWMATCAGRCARETEMLFAHIAREDRSVLDLIDCDYTFVNAQAGANSTGSRT